MRETLKGKRMKDGKTAPRRGLDATMLAFASMAVLVVTGLSFATFVLPFAIWRLMPSKPMNVWVVDKTVPRKDYKEHWGLFWLMQNLKITKAGSRVLYKENSDYFGFYPRDKKQWEASPIPISGAKPDMIYITDTYGVYADDFMQKKLSNDFSPKIYGGLSADDLWAIRRALGDDNTFIAEFNVAASPTNIQNRNALGKLLGVNWKGWIGQYYVDLSDRDAVPRWLIENFEIQKKTTWAYSGKGYVLLAEDDTVEVFLEGRDVTTDGLKINFREPYASSLKLKKPVSYRYYFEFITPDPALEVVADYDLNLTDEGLRHMAELGLSGVFPAIVKYPTPQYQGWYFCGDFGDLTPIPTPYGFWGMSWLKAMLADDTVDDNSYFYWKAYVPLMTSIFKDTRARRLAKATAAPPAKPELTVQIYGSGFKLKNGDGVWEDFFVRGVNMGLAEPGKYFTDFPEDVNAYRRWFDSIADMNANTVRSYTLPPPEFYRALDAHNRENPGKILYLLQEIWPEEHPKNGDYLAEEYRQSYQREIDYGVDAIYGRANIPERKGRAWGVYTTDVSKWLIGWLVGRELESEEVMSTDAKNKGAKYSGRYVSATAEATPTEVWLAESLDTVASIEVDRYGALHPVSLVSWPTLDPKEHDSEWDPETGKKNKGNDRASVTLEHLDKTPANDAGLFGSYHIYPNYPDFINNELAYGSYTDEEGLLRYGGYLREFMSTHRKHPALVAEYGMANGTLTAHFAPDGLDHGGVDETKAGRSILRMERAIHRENYAGGVVFEWMDEWVKKTWTTEYLMIPYERHVFWHNVADPEQNYGLMANDPVPPKVPAATIKGSGIVSSVAMAMDAAWFHLTVKLSRPLAQGGEKLYIGLDTFDRNLGQTMWPVGGLPARTGMEFAIEVSGTSGAQLLVIPSYNVGNAKYASVKGADGVFSRIEPLVNGPVKTKDGRQIPGKRVDVSTLRKGEFDESRNVWKTDGTTYEFRIPWTYINVTDPSSLTVLQDTRTDFFNPGQDSLKTVTTEGFVVSAIVWSDERKIPVGAATGDPAIPYRWEGWEVPPPYVERLKKSYYILKEAWKKPVGAASPAGPASAPAPVPAK